MLIGILIILIGIIPLILAINVRQLYRETELSLGLLVYITLIFIWQLDIGVLYLKDFIEEHVIFELFRLFRLAQIFLIPAVFYIAYITLKKHNVIFKKNSVLAKWLKTILTLKVFVIIVIWSSFIYAINWTQWGVQGLRQQEILNSNIYFYFPEYGELAWLVSFHFYSIIVFLFFIYFIANHIQNRHLKKFLRSIALFSGLLFISGLVNFIPGTGALTSSIGVFIFSTMLIFSFVKMSITITKNYNQLIERQKKLDYIGNLTASLIHEVGNNVQVIKGFTELFLKSRSFSDKDREMINLVHKAAQQLEDISHNFKEFIMYSKIDFEMEDVNKIIECSIELSQDLINKNKVAIEFYKRYETLFAYVNKVYLLQIIINLIKNSCEAIPIDRVNRKIFIDTQIDSMSVFINIIDTGKGIPTKKWENIFNPFTTSKNYGMGLGLSFAKKIIIEHHGDIKIVESSNEGTHVQIQLPLY